MSSAITSLLLCPSNQCFSFGSRIPTSGYSNGVTRRQHVVLCSIVRSKQNASDDEVERIGIRRRDAMLQMACSAFLSATTLSISSPAHSLEDVPGELRLFFDDVNKYNISILEAEGTGENVLAKHVAFFDRNHDGVVYPWETFQGFRAIGSGILLSTVAGFVINIGLSQKTRPGKFPSLLFPIEIKNIAKAKHGSDSGVYDTEGRFVPAKFNAIFSKHANSNPNALTGKELDEMLKANRQPKDYPGRFAAYIEWKILYNLCKDKNGLLQKDTVRGVYDGSLFEKMEMEINSAKKPKHGVHDGK